MDHRATEPTSSRAAEPSSRRADAPPKPHDDEVDVYGLTHRGKVRTLNYKTIRYRGHRDLMAFLLNELRLNDRRDVLKDILENAVPITVQDVVLIFCTVSGRRNGHLIQVTDARKIYHGACGLAGINTR